MWLFSQFLQFLLRISNFQVPLLPSSAPTRLASRKVPSTLGPSLPLVASPNPKFHSLAARPCGKCLEGVSGAPELALVRRSIGAITTPPHTAHYTLHTTHHLPTPAPAPAPTLRGWDLPSFYHTSHHGRRPARKRWQFGTSKGWRQAPDPCPGRSMRLCDPSAPSHPSSCRSSWHCIRLIPIIRPRSRCCRVKLSVGLGVGWPVGSTFPTAGEVW